MDKFQNTLRSIMPIAKGDYPFGSIQFSHTPHLARHCQPFPFLKWVGEKEGKDLVALVSTTCAYDITGLLRHY